MSKATPRKKAANGYKLAEPLPLGETLQDISKKQWKLGASIGQGGFGAIYAAKEATDNSTKYPYVIKIEPHSNGPLFVEMHFYMRNCKKEDVEEFKKKAGLKKLGIPLYIGSGSHEYRAEKYRFVVMEKFGTDLWKLFLENNRIFPASTVFKIAIQMLDVLEYIHSRGYVHADLKGANILMGITKDTQNKQLYLVDFGLATKFNDEPVFKPNPKKAHDGTIEYLSRDAHQGVQTRRGDLEILAYNVIQWLGCVLPWESNLKDPNNVFKTKDIHMSNVTKFLKTCFSKKSPPAPLVEFLNYLTTLKHNSQPDYKKIKKIFLKGLNSGDSLDKPFNFSQSKMPKNLSVSSPKKKISRKKAVLELSGNDTDGDDCTVDQLPSNKTPIKKNGTSISTPNRRSPRRKAVLEPSEDEASELDVDNYIEDLPIAKALFKGKRKNISSVKSKRKSPQKEIVSESSEDEKENDVDLEIDVDVDMDQDTIDLPAAKAIIKRKRKNISSVKSKRKSPRKEIVSESSQDEKENDVDLEIDVDVDMDQDLPAANAIIKRKRKNISSVKSKRKSPRKENVSESSEDEKKKDVDLEMDVDVDMEQETTDISDNQEEFMAKVKPRKKPSNVNKITERPTAKRKPAKESQSENLNLNGYTDAMREILQKKLNKNSKKTNSTSKESPIDNMAGYTDTMKEILLKKQQRLATRSRK